VKAQARTKKTSRRLSELKPGESGTVAETPVTNIRLAEIGLIRGEVVTVLNVAPMGDPVILQILDSAIVVRRVDLLEVFVSP
jgi:Fe2+ transport system protein FeoA